MKFLLNFKLMRLFGVLFQLIPNAEHLDGAWSKGYTLLRALYDFISHFQGGTPTQEQLNEVIAQAEEQMYAAAPPAPAQAPPAGPVAQPDVLAPRSVIEA